MMRANAMKDEDYAHSGYLIVYLILAATFAWGMVAGIAVKSVAGWL
ncbi:MAG: hypothetical protein ACOH2H_16080 [Cypionkella sp.]